LQQAFIDEGAAQCGFCLNGVILTAKAVLTKNPKPPNRKSEKPWEVFCAAASHTFACFVANVYAPEIVASQ
jgi:nicotinate dehydrogenase subunit A